MKIQNSIPTSVKAVTLACAFSLVAVTTSQAVPLIYPTPDGLVAVGSPQLMGGGTVLAIKDVSFVDNALPRPFAYGTLRSFVVDRGGGLLDFYYQLVNQTAPPDIPDAFGTDEFFRMSIPGFAPSWTLAVAQTHTLAGLLPGSSGFVAGSYIQGLGLEDAATVDRGVANANSVGFDFPFFPAFIDNPRNVGAGEASMFLVVRTDAMYYEDVTAVISGAATSFAGTFGASASATSVPETGGSLVFGLTLAGICLAGYRHKPAVVTR